MSDALVTALQVILIIAGVALLAGLVVLGLIYRRLRRLNVPSDADFFQTLRLVPLSLVIALDLLDMGLDVLAAPVSWIILDRLNLKSLRQVAAIEALIPFTGPVPVLTLCWFVARWRAPGPRAGRHLTAGLDLPPT